MTLKGFTLLENCKNIRAKFSENGETLVVLINPRESHGLSKSGKTTSIASTDKWVDVMESGLHLSVFLFAADPDSDVPILIESIRKGVDIDHEMGFTIDLTEEQHIRFTIHCTNEFGLSKSGKSTTVATTEGIIQLGTAKVYLKLHAYRKVGETTKGLTGIFQAVRSQSSGSKTSRKRSKAEASK
ncbi:DEAD-like helicase [Perkinsela sp. CCAP 1560/4]|nr:DEAD-like helicase [Perkinsela sp. CCAP 1560/4]|eukprot:KNH02440.1 DEAD-like helicase [Perkinsela sp. CCAP 1560/4]